MMVIPRSKLRHIVALAAVTAGASAANATVELDLSGLAGTGVTARVWFTYTSSSATNAALEIAIENTSNTGGRISGFAFNVPTFGGATLTQIGGASAGGAVVGLAASDVVPEGGTEETGWFGLWEFEGIKTPNAAGDFDFGVMNNDNANAFITDGAGSGPRIESLPLTANETIFTLDLVGTGLDTGDGAFETAFMSELSSNVGFYNFGVRFQGIANDGSDLATVPVPGAGLLAALGLGVVGWVNRRRG